MNFSGDSLCIRARAALWHLLASFAIGVLSAALVFLLWYPNDYRRLAGGTALFLLVMAVDLTLGPLLTFTVFDVRKSVGRLRRDIAVIVLMQLGALAYGLHAVYVARPVALVLEGGFRFRLVTAVNVDSDELPRAQEPYRRLPVTGPWLLAARHAASDEEESAAILHALRGFDTGQRPSFWQPYDMARSDALRHARPVAILMKQYPTHDLEIQHLLNHHGLTPQTARFIPVIARGDWVAVLDSKADIVAFLPLDGFF